MPIFNLVKNCTYYWAFGAYVSYFVNHPLYTSPAPMYSLALFALAMVCQASNFRCALLAAASHHHSPWLTSSLAQLATCRQLSQIGIHGVFPPPGPSSGSGPALGSRLGYGARAQLWQHMRQTAVLTPACVMRCNVF